jgi:hypothetical protein
MIIVFMLIAGILLASSAKYDRYYAFKVKLGSSLFFGSILVFLANAGLEGPRWVYEWCVYSFYGGGFWLFYLTCKAPSQLLKKEEEEVSEPTESLTKRATAYIYNLTRKSTK